MVDRATRSDEARLDRIESRTAISELIYRYALNVRIGRQRDSTVLFDEAASFEIRQRTAGESETKIRTRLDGREAVINYIARESASGAGLAPLIHNIIVEINGDEATTNCAMTQGSGVDRSFLGVYDDTFRRGGDGVWRFTSRIFTILS